MPRNGSGNYSLIVGYAGVPNDTIESAKYNSTVEDIASALNDSLLHNGIKPMTGNLAMGANKITGLASGTATGDALHFGQIGAQVQAYDAGLTSIAGLTTEADKMIYTTASDTYAVSSLTSFARTILDDADAATALGTLGVSAFSQTLLDDVDAATARATLEVGNVNNTSDADKPVSTATQTALDGKLSTTGGTVTGAVVISSAAPLFRLNETDHAGGNTDYRMALGSGTLFFQYYDGATLASVYSIAPSRIVSFILTPTVAGSAVWHAGNIASQGEAEAGTDNTKGMTPLRTAEAIAAYIAENTYESTGQTITAGGLLTLAHSLGAAPTKFSFRLECVTAEAGWSIGDKPLITLGIRDGATRVNSVWADATNVYVRFSNAATTFEVGNKSTGAITALTNANWRLLVKAEV